MLNNSKSKYIKYVQKAGTHTLIEKIKAEHDRYILIFNQPDNNYYWTLTKINELGESGTELEKCKIISSFAGSDRNCDVEFAKKDESFKKNLMLFFFGVNSANMDYHICKNIHNDKNIVLFYDKTKLSFLVNAFMLHNYFDFTLKNTDIKEILLSLPCEYIRGRPEEEDIIIQMLYGNIEPCVSKDRDVIGTRSVITLESERWNINANTMKLKDIYKTYIQLVYS